MASFPNSRRRRSTKPDRRTRASIDNDESRDLDQLSVAESAGGGRTKVLVAVADVDSQVPAGSASDDHARTNTTSVYTPAEVFPMLAEKARRLATA